MKKRIPLLTLLWAASMSAAGLELTETVRENFGIDTVAVTTGRMAQQWTAAAAVLDAEPLLSPVAELRAAQAASTASANDLRRSETLQQAGNNVSVKVVEEARARAAADRNKVQVLRAQLLSKWGSVITRMPDAQLDRLAQQVLDGRAVLVRMEITGVSGALNARDIQLQRLPDGERFNGRMLGAMPQRAGQSAGRSYLLSVAPGTADLQPGQALDANVRDTVRGVSGIVVPRAALLRWQGQNWVYVHAAANRYQRRRVQVVQWLDDSVLVSEGLSAGDEVVTTGAGLLLGAEQG